MKGEAKSEEQLLTELRDARQRIAELEEAAAQHQRAEEALRECRALLAQARRMASLGNWTWNLRTNEMWWSDELYRMDGLVPGEFTPSFEGVAEITPPEDRELLKQTVEEAVAQGKPFTVEHRIVRPDGSRRFVHTEAEPLFDESGAVVRMVGTVVDITDRRSAD